MVKRLFPVWFSLWASLLWELRDQGALEKIFNFHLGVMVEFSSDIERGLFCQA